ncbi:MAG TPA: phosphoribosyl-AMP cyclohydrolase [Smithella sp.]|mgnify:FL=1|nr:phosphoribosyl-AMP cyclohydrolase [Smithella sp.]HRS98335.1 phosphoribosyl-AMP cyclohydrolase [Smithella sp.]
MLVPNFAKGDGLVPAIVQDAETKEVLMMAYMNRESWEATLKTGKATYWSRSRQRLWLKGESSGNVQIVKAIFIDCDEDTILLQVKQIGEAACHTGYRSCFYRKLEGDTFVIIGEKIFNPEDVYK